MRVIVAEDSVLLREGLIRLLAELGHDTVAAVGDVAGLLGAAATVPVDLILTDVRMPTGAEGRGADVGRSRGIVDATSEGKASEQAFTSEAMTFQAGESRAALTLADLEGDRPITGLTAAIALRRAHPGFPVLVLTQYIEQADASALLSDGQGSVGYLLKDRVQDIDAFGSTLERVAAGETIIDPHVVAQLLVARPVASPLARLTQREREVLALVAEGFSNQAIAERLVIGLGAVEKHIASIFAKLDLPPDQASHRRVHAVLAWLKGA
ncbi:MAG: response regulator transcription factor [Propionibacteriaceae bacterium]|jgi:DNA-binding NarL/FixJ family response regulator|nr:response regulator transcription factor [Propionibacteriaceae bacterium]